MESLPLGAVGLLLVDPLPYPVSDTLLQPALHHVLNDLLQSVALMQCSCLAVHVHMHTGCFAVMVHLHGLVCGLLQ